MRAARVRSTLVHSSRPFLVRSAVMLTWRKAEVAVRRGNELATLHHNAVTQNGTSPTSCSPTLASSIGLSFSLLQYLHSYNCASTSSLRYTRTSFWHKTVCNTTAYATWLSNHLMRFKATETRWYLNVLHCHWLSPLWCRHHSSQLSLVSRPKMRDAPICFIYNSNT